MTREAVTESDRQKVMDITDKYAAGMSDRRKDMVRRLAREFIGVANQFAIGLSLGNSMTQQLGDDEKWEKRDIHAINMAAMALALDLMANNPLGFGK